MEILKVNNVKKTYTSRFGMNPVEALKGVSFSVDKGEYVAIMGESGSGKTTLLNILASFDRQTSGNVVLDGHDISKISDREISAFRRENLGFVFQEFNLLDTFSIKDNILLPLVLNGEKPGNLESRLRPVVTALRINDILEKYPYEVSGGQKQRAAAARAVITNPKLLLADEPTGALDSKSSEDLLNVFTELNKAGQTILMVTHSVSAAAHASRILFIRDGVVFHQIFRGDVSDEQLYLKISDALNLIRTGGERL